MNGRVDVRQRQRQRLAARRRTTALGSASLTTAPPVGAPSAAVAAGREPRSRGVASRLLDRGALLGRAGARSDRGLRAAASAARAPRRDGARRADRSNQRRAAPRREEDASSEVAAASVSLSAEKRRLRDAAEARAFETGAAAILALARAGRGRPAFRRPRRRAPRPSITLGLSFSESTRASAVFDALANHLGADGIDVLYDVASKHGGARAAKKADELLDHPEVRGRASPAVQAALALRDARCDKKPALFDHVGKDGDERALMLLERLRGQNCNASRCCYIKNRPLDTTIAAMKSRLGKG